MYEQLTEILRESDNIVFFGGAGVSTESDIPDFRSDQGLYNARQNYGMSPEQMLSHSFFMSNTGKFFDYYKNNLIYTEAMPNDAHKVLAELEKMGKLKAVVTQNIDGLHQKAGSSRVYELHGSVLRNYCMDCGEYYDLDYIMDSENCDGLIPKCRKCGGTVKPDVVLYEEMLDDEQITGAVDAIGKADTLIIGGTSLVVYPAAGFVNYYRGDKLVLINKSETSFDNRASLVINDSIGKVLKAAFEGI
ncbi:MAG: NAD-dependent protein deacylase [Clostridiales bacterium]|nr:NAD-dependent protein deacylase [Clostridiales bacterium]